MTETGSSTSAVTAAVERTRALLERQRETGASPLRHIAHCFNLSSFELNILMLCAAVELDVEAPRYPTFALAFNAFEDCHWSAAAPQGALRKWRLIEVGAGESLMSAPLRIDEWVLHYLMGMPAVDERIAPLLEPIEAPSILPASYQVETARLAAIWAHPPGPVAVLRGNATVDKRAVAAAAGASAQLEMRVLDAARIPASPAEREELIRLLERDAVLNGCGLVIESDSEPARAFAERFGGAIAIVTKARFLTSSRPCAIFTIDTPPVDEQMALWKYALGAEAVTRSNGSVERAAAQFSFDSQRILAAGHRVAADSECDLWAECRAEARPLLDGLAERVETNARWDDLVLPEPCMDTLRAMTAQVRNQDTVLRRWGLAGGGTRGLGVSALFHGQSGTGKTLAAEVIANELNLDLYRIDLSQVVSKYIGETEKNLCAVFDGAENTGAVLLFDEADALFGKRSEVRDSHDRYANIEVGYLLQRMEAYRGIALLTTNLRSALDPAFLRRIRFLVHFPFPDQPLRRRIWSRMFSPSLPLEGVDLDKLARLNVPGGSIRNIALSAAYLAAEAGTPVRMPHLAAAARRECAKLDRTPAEQEIGGWA
jgi:hypothetical protein